MTGYATRLVCNDLDGYRARGETAIAHAGPRIGFAASDGFVEALGSTSALSSVTTITGTDAQPRFAAVADPLDADKKAIFMRLSQGDALTAGSPRVEFSHSLLSQRLIKGARYWVGFSLMVPTAWKSAPDETILFQLHDDGDAGDDPVMHAPILLIVTGAAQRLDIRTSSSPITTVAGNSLRTAWSEASWPADVWQHFAMEVRLHWDASFAPILRLWRRVSGATTQLCDDSQPNDYNNVAHGYVKHGIYYYPNNWTGITTRQMHSKGLYVWAADDTTTAADVLDFLEAV